MSMYVVVYGDGYEDMAYLTHMFNAIIELGGRHGAYMIGDSSFQPFIRMLMLDKNGQYLQKGKRMTLDSFDAFFDA